MPLKEEIDLAGEEATGPAYDQGAGVAPDQVDEAVRKGKGGERGG